jgi:signal transduction histidine kinase
VRLPSPISRLRLSSIALALASLFALAGLYAMDRTISESYRARVQLEAVEAGALVEGFLTVHAEALQSIRGLYLDTTRVVDSAHFQSLVLATLRYAPAFRRIWITDSAGRVVKQHLFGTGARALPAGWDIDTVRALSVNTLAQQARQTRRLQISPPGALFTGEPGVILLEPIFIGERFRGIAGGSITSAALLEQAMRGSASGDRGLTILADRDTVAVAPDPPARERAAYVTASVLRLPGDPQWRVVVARSSRYQQMRALVWGIGLAILGALVAVLLHEHGQAQRLAERSSELERLSVELLRTNRTKSEFLANMSHELRTPLNAIVGFVELLRDGIYGELAPRQVIPVERIASSATHLRQLVDQILDLAKMAAGRLEVHPELIDLRPFVLNVASEVEALVQERGLNSSIVLGAGLPRVRTDPMHLRQILLNLLGNAIKFTPSGGIAIRARLVAERDGVTRALWSRGGTSAAAAAPPTAAGHAWVALQIADSGIGIAPTDRERIFEEFEQVNAGPRSDSIQRGTGLGLPISRRLARLLGGDLTVESEPGKGSTFTVWLPVERQETGSRRQDSGKGSGVAIPALEGSPEA